MICPTETPEEKAALDRIDNKSTFQPEVGKVIGMAKCADKKCHGSKEPVFTREMADNGELPPVGAPCLISLGLGAVPESCEIIASWRGKFWVRLYDGICETVVSDPEFTPIDTRTDEEKSIDSFKAFEDEYGNWTWDDLLDQLKGGRFDLVKWAGK